MISITFSTQGLFSQSEEEYLVYDLIIDNLKGLPVRDCSSETAKNNRSDSLEESIPSDFPHLDIGERVTNIPDVSQNINDTPSRNFFSPGFTGFFIGAGPSYSMLKHQSSIHQSFVSNSPVGSFSLFGGISLLNNKLRISFESIYNYSIITHDESILVLQYTTAYYADIENVSILTLGFNLELAPFQFWRIEPFFSVGVKANSYIDYSRTVMEQLLLSDIRVVVTNFYDDFPEPDQFRGLDLKSGLSFDLSGKSSIRASFQIVKYKNPDSGPQTLKGGAIHYIINFN
jgi:hypothetical protein